MKTNVIYADMSEILFENRNKNYGGYVLRKSENANLAKGIFSAMAAFAIFFSLYLYFSPAAQMVQIDNGPLETMYIQPIELPDKPEPPPVQQENPPPSQQASTPEPAAPAQQTDFREPVPVADPVADPNASMTPNDSVQGNPGTTNSNGTGPGTGPGTGTGTGPGSGPGNGDTDFNQPFDDTMVSASPKPLNMAEVKKGIRYPRPLLEAQMKGQVYLRVLVGKDGSVEQTQVLRSSHRLFTEAAMNQIDRLRFQPGKMGDIPVRVWVTIPFVFNLND